MCLCLCYNCVYEIYAFVQNVDKSLELVHACSMLHNVHAGKGLTPAAIGLFMDTRVVALHVLVFRIGFIHVATPLPTNF